MKTIFQVFLFVCLVSLCGCRPSAPTQSGATGRAYDVLVVMPDTLWMGPAGDTLRAILTENPMILPQPEPLYSVIQVDPQETNRLMLRHRNVILFQPGRQEQPSMTVEYDVHSKPQAVVRIAGPSVDVMTDYMEANRFALQGIFDIAERERTVAGATRSVDRDIRDTILNRFGLHINVMQGYRIRAQYPDFIWISYETPVLSQGIMVYKYPLAGRESLTRTALIENRNRFISQVPGSNKGSYMRTADVIPPVLSTEVIHNRRWFKLSGLWDMENGFQGGPFNSYSTINTTTNEMVTVDLYVYSPKNPKRNYVKFLEGIMHTARIPGDTVGTIRWVDVVRNQVDTLK